MKDEKGRAELGRERVGEPIAGVFRAFLPAIMSDEIGGRVNSQVMMQYVNDFLFGTFVHLIDQSTKVLSNLQAVQPEGVQQAVLLLLRDVLMRELVAVKTPDDEAVMESNRFIEKLAEDVDVVPDTVLEPALPLDTENLDASCDEAVGPKKEFTLKAAPAQDISVGFLGM